MKIKSNIIALFILSAGITSPCFSTSYSLINNTDYLCTLDPIPTDISKPIPNDGSVDINCATTNLCQNEYAGTNGYAISLITPDSHKLQERLLEPQTRTIISTPKQSAYLELKNTSCRMAIKNNYFQSDNIQDGDQYILVMIQSPTFPNLYTTVTLNDYYPQSSIVWFTNESNYICTGNDFDETTGVVILDDSSFCITSDAEISELSITTGAQDKTWSYTFTTQDQQFGLPINDEGNYTIQNASQTITSQGSELPTNTQQSPYYIIQYNDDGNYYLSKDNPADHPYPYATFTNTENFICTYGIIDPDTQIITLDAEEGSGCIYEEESGANLTLTTGQATSQHWSHEFTPSDIDSISMHINGTGYYKVDSDNYSIEGSGLTDKSDGYYIIQHQDNGQYYLSNNNPADYPYYPVTFQNKEIYACFNGVVDTETQIVTLSKDAGSYCVEDSDATTDFTLTTDQSSPPRVNWSHDFTPTDIGPVSLTVDGKGYYKIDGGYLSVEGSGIKHDFGTYYILQNATKDYYHLSNQDPALFPAPNGANTKLPTGKETSNTKPKRKTRH